MSAVSGFGTSRQECDPKQRNLYKTGPKMPDFMEKYAHRPSIRAVFEKVYVNRTKNSFFSEKRTNDMEEDDSFAKSPVAEYIRRPVTPFDKVIWKSNFRWISSRPDSSMGNIYEIRNNEIKKKWINNTNDILLAGIEELHRYTTVRDVFDSYRRTLDKYYKQQNFTHSNEYNPSDKKTVAIQTGSEAENSRNKSVQVDLKIIEKANMENKQCQTENQQPAMDCENMDLEQANMNIRHSANNLLGWGWTATASVITRGALFGLGEILRAL